MPVTKSVKIPVFYVSYGKNTGYKTFLCHAGIHKTLYICRLIWLRSSVRYLVTNLAGHLDLAGFYFSKCPANSKPPAFSSCDLHHKPKFKYNIFSWDWTRAPTDRMWTLYQWAMESIDNLIFRFNLTTRVQTCFGGFFSIFLTQFLLLLLLLCTKTPNIISSQGLKQLFRFFL